MVGYRSKVCFREGKDANRWLFCENGMKLKNLSHVQIIALGYLLIILCGTLLLMLPIATTSGESASFLTALFTATSSACVTGLVTVDTGTFWSLFGQIVILALIQIGGLGFMTIATFFFRLFRRRMGLRQKEVMVESINTSEIGGILQLAKNIFLLTMLIEGCGAVILALRFGLHYGFGWKKSLFFGVFHSISAFCNAGFDLNGNYNSFTDYVGDPVINLTLMTLIIIGGIGFLVWHDLAERKFRFRSLRLHTKIVLSVTAILILAPALLFFFFERNGLFADLNWGEKILASLFSAVTPRTAGFNTVDTASLSPGSGLLTVVLMFIGGSPGSTAGGAKTTTVAVLLFFTIASIRKNRAASLFGRRIPEDALHKAVCVFFWNLGLALCGILLIAAIQPALPFFDVLFEVFSAIGTVGMSTGVTRDLNTFSQALVILLMFIGRIGGVSFGAALLEKKAVPAVIEPHESILIG